MKQMASKRLILGSILVGKPENGGGRYLKVAKDVSATLKEGDIVIIETKKEQIASAKAAGAAGKLSADIVAQIVERVEKQPEFVFGQAVLKRQA
jgi:hypothetical protein